MSWFDESSKEEFNKVSNEILEEKKKGLVSAISESKSSNKIAEKENDFNKENNFKFEEAPNLPQEVYTIYGAKGEGKTALAYSFSGTKAVLSFDKKSILTKKNLFDGNKEIKVFDAIKYLNENPEQFVQSSSKTYEYVIFLLENIAKEKVDWVIIDGLEIFTRIGEMVMRAKHNLGFAQGIANINLWKERRLIIRNLHKKALDASKKGVIYTTYTKEESIVEDGTLISKKLVPNWMGIVMEQTDCLLYVYSKQEKEGKRFYVEVVTSKNDRKIKTGKIIDITDFKNSIFEK